MPFLRMGDNVFKHINHFFKRLNRDQFLAAVEIVSAGGEIGAGKPHPCQDRAVGAPANGLRPGLHAAVGKRLLSHIGNAVGNDDTFKSRTSGKSRERYFCHLFRKGNARKTCTSAENIIACLCHADRQCYAFQRRTV